MAKRAEPQENLNSPIHRRWRRWRARERQRRALSRLDRRLLDDVGLSERDAAKECAKPFWCA
ncbi:MAG: DUF1127 domain-containing protein [Alphaproteobacteria bacterium]|nr:DUF1127 domain-containing protein [Alphaproteobacteria bacterium]